jgi:hypothetical protein
VSIHKFAFDHISVERVVIGCQKLGGVVQAVYMVSVVAYSITITPHLGIESGQ